MATYFPAYLYRQRGARDSVPDPEFIGYAIVREHEGNGVDEVPFRLDGVHVYGPSEKVELVEQLALLNKNADLKPFWPDAKDPEVEAIYGDSSFEPYPTNERDQPLNDKGEVDWNVPYNRLAKAQEIIARKRKEAAGESTSS
jgi:hypothetical protein